jgi:hypothetical protein
VRRTVGWSTAWSHPGRNGSTTRSRLGIAGDRLYIFRISGAGDHDLFVRMLASANLPAG